MSKRSRERYQVDFDMEEPEQMGRALDKNKISNLFDGLTVENIQTSAEILYERFLLDKGRYTNQIYHDMKFIVERYHIFIQFLTLLVEEHYDNTLQVLRIFFNRQDRLVAYYSYALDKQLATGNVRKQIERALEYVFEIYTLLFEQSTLTEAIDQVFQENYEQLAGPVIEYPTILLQHEVLRKESDKFVSFPSIETRSTKNQKASRDKYITLEARLDELLEFRNQFNKPTKSARK